MLQRRSRTSYGNHFRRFTGKLRGFLPLLLLLVFTLLVFQLFSIKKTDCLLNGAPCPAEILEKINKYHGTSVLVLNQKKLLSSIQSSSPIEKLSLGFKLFNTLVLKIEGRVTSLGLQTALVQSLPKLSLDQPTVGSESAVFNKPSTELEVFSRSQNFDNYEIWSNGLMSPTASSESKIKYYLTSKPDEETIKNIYALVTLVEKYLTVEQYWILNQTFFLRQQDQPDIIVNIPFEEPSLVEVLQSYTYLTTIKKDTKVIDLRFKNPILR